MAQPQHSLSDAPPRPVPAMSPGDHVVCMGAAVVATIRVFPHPNLEMYREVLERALATPSGGHDTVEVLRKKLAVSLSVPGDIVASAELEQALHNFFCWRLAKAVEAEAAL